MMQEARAKLNTIEGLKFYKLLGTGGGNSFQIYPNFSVFGILGVWETEDNAEKFIDQSNVFAAYTKRSSEQKTFYMNVRQAEGKWSGKNPFTPIKEGNLDSKPVAVITRATIRPSQLISFWKRVPSVSDSIVDHEDMLFSTGIGEWPIIQQATFSVWTSEAAMKAAIYGNKKHNEVIKLTRTKNWYSEELFARFTPYRERGSWNDQKKILKNYD